MDTQGSERSARPELTRGVGAWAAIAVNVANMIGTGVFLKARVMTCNVGDARTVLLVWVAAGLLSLAGTFSYSEIAAMMPEAGGDYIFLRRAYGRLVGFLFGWMSFAVARAGSQAALAVGLAIFMNVALGGVLENWRVHEEILGLHLRLGGLTVVALITIWTVALINCASVIAGGRTALAVTIVKVILVVGVGLAAFAFAPGDWSHLTASGIDGTCEGVAGSARGGMAGFGAAMLGALWAYDGWQNVAPLAGEIRHPQRNLPRAFVGGMLIVGVLYLFVNLAYYYALTPLEIASVPVGSSVATEVLKRFWGHGIAVRFPAHDAGRASALPSIGLPDRPRVVSGGDGGAAGQHLHRRASASIAGRGGLADRPAFLLVVVAQAGRFMLPVDRTPRLRRFLPDRSRAWIRR